jgi:hypothetical protein
MPVAAAALAAPALLLPAPVSAQGLFDFLFGGLPSPQREAPSPSRAFAAPVARPPHNGSNPRPTPLRTAHSGPAFCVRTCDGRYFPLTRGGAAARMCQAFCPASATKVYFGSSIDSATASNGERYANSENAYAYRKALRADCTCNGRDPTGIVPFDLALDNSLRPGDVVATTDGLVAYSGAQAGNSQTAEFIPIASYAGLTAEVRTRLDELKVAPVNAIVEMDAVHAPEGEVEGDVAPAMSAEPEKMTPGSATRAALE